MNLQILVKEQKPCASHRMYSSNIRAYQVQIWHPKDMNTESIFPGNFLFFSLPLAKCRLKFQGKLISLIHSWWVTVDVARRITKHLCCHSLAVFMSLCAVWSFIIDVTKNIMFYRNFKKEKKRGTLWKHIRSPAYQRSSISNMLDLWYGLGNVFEMKEWHIVWWKLN